MKTNTDGNLPGSYAPLDQLGLKIALGMESYPSNRMIMCYGPPGSGKSTLLYSLIGQYVKNKDEVWLVDQEQAIDEIYLASYIPNLDGDKEEQLAFEYGLKTAEARLKKENKLKDDERASPAQLAKLEQRIETLKTILSGMKKAVKEAVKSGEELPALAEADAAEIIADVPARTYRSLLLRCRADYRIRAIKILRYEHLEDFEKEMIKLTEERSKDPKLRHSRLLIGVDSINYLLPKDVLDRATSSEGSNLTAAKYLHTMLPRFINKMGGSEISMMFIHQQTTHIKMNFWEQANAINDVATKGGSAAKFGATLMIGVEKRKKMKGADEKEYDSGLVSIPKMKLRCGSKGTFKGKFLLKEDVTQSTMDFNEPFILEALAEEQYGIRKNRGSYFVPQALLANHPDFEVRIQPELQTFPKEEDKPALYFKGKEDVLIDLLSQSPAFEEECLLAYGILQDI